MIRISSHCFKNIYYGCSPSPVNPSKDEEETILYIFMILAGQLICFVSVCERERKKEKWPDANSLPLFSKLLMRHTHTHTHTTMHNTDTQKEREKQDVDMMRPILPARLLSVSLSVFSEVYK